MPNAAGRANRGMDMNDVLLLRRVWLTLLGITVGSALLAESAAPAVWVAVLIGITVGLKGQLVVDRLMGLREAHPLVRRVMLSYFYLLPPLIVLGLAFPDAVARWTTLS